MDTREAVILAVEWLLRHHRADLLAAHQVTACFLPNFGHGDDIWLRTEAMHVVAEVTTSGADKRWQDVKGPKRQNINRKIQALKDRTNATHRYLFVVGEHLAKSLQSAAGEGVVVIPLVVASPVQPIVVAEEPGDGTTL